MTLKDQFELFRSNLASNKIEVSDSSNIYQCMDLAYLWVFTLEIAKGTIQRLYAYQTYKNANDLTKKYFEVIPNTPDYVPAAGDLVVFDKGVTTGNTAGHICIATGEGNTKKFKSLDQNWKVGSGVTEVEHTYTKCLGALRPKVKPTHIPAKFDVEADLSSEIEADAGLKAYEWYDKRWSFKQLVEFTDETYRQNKENRTRIVELENRKPTLKEAINVLLSFVGGK